MWYRSILSRLASLGDAVPPDLRAAIEMALHCDDRDDAERLMQSV